MIQEKGELKKLIEDDPDHISSHESLRDKNDFARAVKAPVTDFARGFGEGDHPRKSKRPVVVGIQLAWIELQYVLIVLGYVPIKNFSGIFGFTFLNCGFFTCTKSILSHTT